MRQPRRHFGHGYAACAKPSDRDLRQPIATNDGSQSYSEVDLAGSNRSNGPPLLSFTDSHEIATQNRRQMAANAWWPIDARIPQSLNHEYIAQPGRLRRPGRGLQSNLKFKTAKRNPTPRRHPGADLDRRLHTGTSSTVSRRRRRVLASTACMVSATTTRRRALRS